MSYANTGSKVARNFAAPHVHKATPSHLDCILMEWSP